ncbi:hypothetical protein JTF06_12725 [Desemzia sp. RIT804]|uniref:hypothetical protein n=1 Tax=Desemzia sp. RIT 804 TaxID=2810209 RepID=UPI00194F7735|nr:hypothetical protein [Desemzia sp. RIT 804]MBM6615749.1 hypothetical protein [Desemzia sp. RIT 804]
MNEYQSILSLYQKHKRYEVKIILFSCALLVLTSVFVALNLFRISPFILYLIAMGITLYFALRIRVESKNYGKLERFLKENDPEVLKNKELVFFIDYQLDHSFEQESKGLFKGLDDKNGRNNFEKKVSEIKDHYEDLVANTSIEQNIETSS